MLPIGNCVASRYKENAESDVKARVESCGEKKVLTDDSAAITGVLTNVGAVPAVVTPTTDANTEPAGRIIELFGIYRNDFELLEALQNGGIPVCHREGTIHGGNSWGI